LAAAGHSEAPLAESFPPRAPDRFVVRPTKSRAALLVERELEAARRVMTLVDPRLRRMGALGRARGGGCPRERSASGAPPGRAAGSGRLAEIEPRVLVLRRLEGGSWDPLEVGGPRHSLAPPAIGNFCARISDGQRNRVK